jgi:hypothetical protein
MTILQQHILATIYVAMQACNAPFKDAVEELQVETGDKNNVSLSGTTSTYIHP